MNRKQIIQHPTYKHLKRSVDFAMEESAKGNPYPLEQAIAKAKGK